MRPNFINHELEVDNALLPQVLTADANGAGIDCRGYEGGVIFAVHLGQSGDVLSGSVKVELEVEESDDDSTYDDAEDADLVDPNTGGAGAVSGSNTGTFAVIDAAAEDETIKYVRYVGDKRYARVVVNLTGTHTNGIPVSAVALRQPKYPA